MIINSFPGTSPVKVFATQNGQHTALMRDVSADWVPLTATANDIRKGFTAATERGLVEGEKEIPVYYTTEGYKVVQPNKQVTIPLEDKDLFDYSALQVIITLFDTSISNSVSAQKISILDAVYAVNSSIKEADVIKDDANKSIDLGITNTSSDAYVVRYFTYKEVE